MTVDIILGIIKESYFLLNKMSPYLLFGFLFAGLIHVFIDTETVGRHLGRSSVLSVVKASLFGIPLPLCSCGVLPAAMSLRKEGASRGAILSFLISTPTTGVDSIFATFSLLGGFFAAYRVAASFLAGVFSGVLANLLLKDETPAAPSGESAQCKLCAESEEHSHTVPERIKGVFTYAFGELLGDIGVWLLAGVAIGGVIAYFLPDEFIRTYLGSGWQAMLVMLLVGAPMYVCATGSIPIAAALMLKGMNPGAAFVFLLAGPATNAVGMTVVSRQMGKKALAIYVFSIALSSVALGMLLDILWNTLGGIDVRRAIRGRAFLPGWVETAASVLLLVLVAYNLFTKLSRPARAEMK